MCAIWWQFLITAFKFYKNSEYINRNILTENLVIPLFCKKENVNILNSIRMKKKY